jgi:hypothetical protein
LISVGGHFRPFKLNLKHFTRSGSAVQRGRCRSDQMANRSSTTAGAPDAGPALPMDVLGFYGALVVWAGLLGYGFKSGKRGSFNPFLLFGIVLLVAINTRYFVEGPAAGIAFFVAIYDV